MKSKFGKLFGHRSEDELSEARQKEARRLEADRTLESEILKRRRFGDQLKSKIDQANREQAKLRTDALVSLERGDELDAQLLCSLIKIKKLSIERNTKLYLFNLRVTELLSQKQIFLKSFGTDTDLTLGNDLLDGAELEKLAADLKSLDIDLALWGQSLDKTVDELGSGEIFDELVSEWKRRMELGALSDPEIPDISVAADVPRQTYIGV